MSTSMGTLYTINKASLAHFSLQFVKDHTFIFNIFYDMIIQIMDILERPQQKT